MSDIKISESACHTLAQICRLNRGLMHNLVGGIGLHQGQPYVLEQLWKEDGLTHKELSEGLHVSPATISNTIKRMEKAGFVVRQQDEHDERVSRVYLTDAGHAIQNDVMRLWIAFEKRALEGFAEEERTLLQNLLKRIHDNLLQIDCGDLLTCVQA